MSDISDLDAHLGFWLRYVSNHVSQAFAARLAAHRVTPAEWVILRSLHDKPPIAPSRLAGQLGMTKGAITKLADRLIAKGLVVRRASAEDGRAQTLALTSAGSGRVPRLAMLADRNDAEFFGRIPARDRRHLQRILKKMVARSGMVSVPVE